MDYKGSWLFSRKRNPEYSTEDGKFAYPEYFDILDTVMDILFKYKLLIPTKINSTIIQANVISEFSNQAKQIIGEKFGANIRGNTIIYTDQGEEIHSNILHLDFPAYENLDYVFIALYSYIFLPLIFNKEDYDFEWNLECYYLNHHRIKNALQEIDLVLKWKNTTKYDCDNYEMGVMQIGFKTFMYEQVIKDKYEEEPPDEPFDLEAYLQEIKEARVLSDQYYEELRKKNG